MNTASDAIANGMADSNRTKTFIVDRVRKRLLDQGVDVSSANIVCALRDEGIVLDENTLPHIVERVHDELVGAGPLENFLHAANVSDVLVTSDGHVWVDTGSGLENKGQHFSDSAHVRRVASRLASRVGRRLDDASPFVDARLPDGTRLHGVIEPIATDGACLSLRIPHRGGFTLEQLAQTQSVDEPCLRLLRRIIASRSSFLVTGATGSGKTTVLGALLAAVSPRERIVIVEDTAELQPQHPHVVRLQSRPANIEGAGQVTMRDLVRQSLRMRPDRIVVGEVRGAEVIDLLTALNTGHRGGCGTIHANSPMDAMKRIEALGLTAGVPRDATHALISAAIDIVVHLERLPSGRRVVSDVHEVRDEHGLCVTSALYGRGGLAEDPA